LILVHKSNGGFMAIQSTRGGRRPGSGRPAGEKTQQIRVPLGILDAVNDLVRIYKSGEHVPPVREYKQDDFFEHDDSEPFPLKAFVKIEDQTIDTVTASHLKAMQDMSKKQQKKLVTRYGSLEAAANNFARKGVPAWFG
jgi:hypothetical protein